jgi:hypothetical protein
MVRQAVAPSPMKRSVTLAELERSCSMLHKMAVYSKAEEVINIKPIRGLLKSCLFGNKADIKEKRKNKQI